MRLAVLLACTVIAGCAGAKPFERENLATSRMQFGADPLADTVEQHVFQYREGTTGGYGGSGGGCGCN